jgi:uncharacterized protein YdaU (DUF1376 family)
MSFMKSPAFQFYSSDWLSSQAVRLMDAEQRGWYIQLLAESWESKPQATLKDDDAFLRVLAGVNDQAIDVENRWKVVKSQFKRKGKLLYNDRLMDEVVKQAENREKKRLAGQASSEARRATREALKTEHLNKARNGTQKPNTCSTHDEICSLSSPTERQQNPTLQSSSSISIVASARVSKPRDPRLDHPALKAVFSVKGKYPSRDVWDLVIEKLGENPDIARMKDCWLHWRAANYGPENLGWLVDWYVNGVPERNRKNDGKNKRYLEQPNPHGSGYEFKPKSKIG